MKGYKQDDKTTIHLPRQHLSFTDGGIHAKGHGRSQGLATPIPHRVSGYQP